MLKNTYKDKITTFIGVLVMMYGLSCYMFSWPNEKQLWINVGEVAVGFMLLFVDGRIIGEAIIKFFRKKLGLDE